MRTVTSAGGVVFKEKDGYRYILLVVKPNGKLFFPKGHVEPGETIEEAAVREVREETGLRDIVLGEKLGIVTRPSTEVTHEKVIKDIHLFAMTSQSEIHDRADERYGWFLVEEALTRFRYKQEKEFLEKMCKK